jgi:glycosyltransferase involved in cell wall biosynthesis
MRDATVRYSVIIPVYNRPQEVEELLLSLTKQVFTDFEVIIVEDGSTVRCETIVNKFSQQLTCHYFFKPNSGPGPSRNFGYSHANGQYFVVFDSDCIIPPQYFETVEQSLAQHNWDAWGGPDRAHEGFTPVQRAMGYTMASVLTTGGIRGAKKSVGWFQPRSFNMGISRRVFQETGGFAFDRFAEDIEFSIRMKKRGFNVGLIPDAYVYHKRRTNFRQFYYQVYNFGRGRVLVGRIHPEEVRLTHWFPSMFVGGTLSIPFLYFLHPVIFWVGFGGYCSYLAAIFVDSLRVNANFKVAFLSVPSALLQLGGYGVGFLKERIKPYV